MKNKKQCWDLLESELYGISEQRAGGECAEARMAVSVIVSAGRDNDRDFLDSHAFKYWCKQAYLYPNTVRKIINKTFDYLDGKAETASYKGVF